MSNEMYIVAKSYSTICPGIYVFSTLKMAEKMRDKMMDKSEFHRDNHRRISITRIDHINSDYPIEVKIWDSYNIDHNITEEAQ